MILHTKETTKLFSSETEFIFGLRAQTNYNKNESEKRQMGGKN